VLINNAGIAGAAGKPADVTAEEVEDVSPARFQCDEHSSGMRNRPLS